MYYPIPIGLYPSPQIYPTFEPEYITDRTINDVNEWYELRTKVINDTATEDELIRWLLMEEIRGCLNYKDFNRWGTLLKFLAKKGIQIAYPTVPKTNWKVNDNITHSDITELLANVRVVRNLTGVPHSTPQVPSSIMDYRDANAIETILKVGYETIINTQLGFRYCGEIYSGNTY